MALFEEQITDTLETGAPSIKYEGDEGPQDPRQEQMLAQLKEEYMQYVFEMKELQEPVMSFEEWYQSVYQASKMGVQAPQEDITAEEVMMREPAAYGGIMDTDSGRRMYGFGSFFKKITNPFKKIAKGAKKLIKSPIGKIGIGALLAGPALGALTGSGAATSGFLSSGAAGGASLAKIPWYKKGVMEGIGTLAKKVIQNPKTLAKIGIGAASALPLLGIGTKAKQDQIENFSQSGDWDENFKSAGGFPGMRRAIARAKDQAELEGLADQFGFTPGLFPQVAADGGRIGYAGGEMVEGMAEGVEKVGRGGSEIIEKIKEGIIEGGKDVAAPFIDESIWLEKIKDSIKPGSVDVIEKIKEGIIEGGRRGLGAPFIDEAIWIEKIKDFIRKKRGEGRPMMDKLNNPDMPRRGYALGTKADFAIEDVMTGGMEDEIGGITGIMRQADLQRKGNVGQFYAAQGGRIGYADGGDGGSFDSNKYYEDEYNKYIKDIELGLNEFADTPMSFSSFVKMLREDRAQGGRIGAQEGGIMDLGGMEKDYRNTGGFVELGAEEKADDVPARLSKNEFVMTADAVRGAGDGDIDKGASIMENMMKELEQKGQEDMKMAGPDWYLKRIEHLMFLGYDYDEAAAIALDNNKYDEIIGDPMARKQGAQDMFEVSERLSEVV